jgi:hypothetical protein
VAATVRAGPVAQVAVDPAVPGRAALAVTGLVDRVDPVRVDPATTDLAAQVGRVDRAVTDLADRVGPVDLVITDLAAQVDLVITDLAAPVDPAAQVGTDRADRVVPALHGTATTIAATSITRRGVMDPHPGAPASRRIRTGAGRFPRQEGVGTTDRSITTATTRTRSGTRDSTSGDSTSSESGSRCKDSPLQTPASPIGGAGVARFASPVAFRRVTV